MTLVFLGAPVGCVPHTSGRLHKASLERSIYFICGAGSAVAEFLANAGVQVQMRHIAIPDGFIHHGSQQQNRETAGLTRAAILEAGTLTAAVDAVVSKIV